MRSYLDINNNTPNARFMKSAKKYYEVIESRLIHKHTLDIWAFGLDQYGLLEMKDIAVKSGGLVAMHELFDHFIF
jgi:protein transport protein SEC23